MRGVKLIALPSSVIGRYNGPVSCLICDRIEEARRGINKYAVAELETGFVVIGDHQLFKGYSLFLCKEHVSELHDLDESYRIRFLLEMSEVAAAVGRAFDADILNCEKLGNTDTHLHWHIFPRRHDDAAARKPVWTVPKADREKAVPSDEELEFLKSRLAQELSKIPGR